jgi:hypothetical protein
MLTGWVIEKRERTDVTHMAASACVLGTCVILSKIGVDSFLLTTVRTAALGRMLPIGMLVTAVLILSLIPLVRRLHEQYSRCILAVLTGLFSVGLTALIGVMVIRPTAHVALTAYVGAETGTALITASLWWCMDGSLRSMNSRGIHQLIVVAGAVGMAFGAGLALALSRFGGVQIVLWGAVVSAVILGIVGYRQSTAYRTTHSFESITSEFHRAMGPGAWILVLVAAFAVLAVTQADALWKLRVAADVPHAGLLSFYALAYLGFAVMAVPVGLVIAPRVLTRTGFTPSLMIYPVVLVVCAVGFLLSSALVAAGAFELSERVLNRALHRRAMRQQYLFVDRAHRAALSRLIEGGVRPVARCLGAISVLVLLQLGGMHAVAASILICALGAAFAVHALVRRRRIPLWRAVFSELTSADADARSVGEALPGMELVFFYGNAGEARRLLDLLARLPGETQQVLVRTLERRREPELVASALRLLYSLRPPGDSAEIIRWTRHREPAVRSVALEVLARHFPGESGEVLITTIDDPAIEVRSDACRWLLSVHVGGGADRAHACVKDMSRSADPSERRMGVRVMGGAPSSRFVPLIRDLLDDPVLDVRVAAIRAVGRGRYDALRHRVYEMLTDYAVRSAALTTLTKLGGVVCGDARRFFGRYPEAQNLCSQLPALLTHIDSAEATHVLVDALDIRDSALRRRIGTALQARVGLGMPGEPSCDAALMQVDELIARISSMNTIVAAYYQELRLRRIYSTIFAERGGTIETLMIWISLAFPECGIAGVIDRARHSDESGREKLVSEAGVILGSERAGKLFSALFPRRDTVLGLTTHDAVVTALYDASEWNRMAGAAAAVILKYADMESLLRTMPVMRLATPAGMRVTRVWAAASALLSEDREPSSEDREMWTHVERVMALKAVPLFSSLDTEAIWQVAGIVEEVRLETGQPLLVEGQPGEALYVVMSGEMGIRKDDKEVNTLGPGEVIGEMSLLDDVPISVSVSAASEAVLFRLGSGPFYALMATHFEITRLIIESLTQRLRTMTGRSD